MDSVLHSPIHVFSYYTRSIYDRPCAAPSLLMDAMMITQNVVGTRTNVFRPRLSLGMTGLAMMLDPEVKLTAMLLPGLSATQEQSKFRCYAPRTFNVPDSSPLPSWTDASSPLAEAGSGQAVCQIHEVISWQAWAIPESQSPFGRESRCHTVYV